MKRTLAATAIVLATAAAANAASPTTWQGDMFINIAPGSTTCGAAGVTTGDFVQAIFTPVNTQNNTPTDQLAVFFPRGGAHQIVPATGTKLAQAPSVTITHIKHDAGLRTDAKMALPISISAPAQGTQLVTVSFTISDFGTSTGCSVTLKGVLHPRPGNLGN